MGASGWSYFVPYQQDIEQALQQLREQVFASGDFLNHKAIEVEWLRAQDDQAYHEYQQRDREFWQSQEVEPPETEARQQRIARLEQEQTTIAGLFLDDEGEGTHSILDIYALSDTAAYHTAILLPLEKVQEIFGTEHPPHTMIELRMKEVMLEAVGRWIGAYIVIWKDDQPDEIFFFGFSGD